MAIKYTKTKGKTKYGVTKTKSKKTTAKKATAKGLTGQARKAANAIKKSAKKRGQ